MLDEADVQIDLELHCPHLARDKSCLWQDKDVLFPLKLFTVTIMCYMFNETNHLPEMYQQLWSF